MPLDKIVDALTIDGDTYQAVQDSTRFVLKNALTGDELQFTKHDDNSWYIEIDEPMAGSTDTGFGVTTSFTIPAPLVAVLKKWLNRDQHK